MDEVAYLRQYESSRQCELIFNLHYNKSVLESLEVKVSQPITNTVSEFVDAIKDSVEKVLAEYLPETNVNQENVEQEKDITACFQRDAKYIKGHVILKQFMDQVNENVKLKVCGQTYRIFVDAPLLKQLKLPIALYANFTVQPWKFHSLFTDHQASQYLWYKSIDKVNWEKVGKGYQYTIKESDIGYFLKLCCILYNKSLIKGPTVSVISDSKVETTMELPRCPFEDRHTYTAKKLKGGAYRIVSYNILADKYANENQYEYCPQKALAIDYRKQLILKELAGYNADIICLQEVDNLQYTKYYHEKFRDFGYGGIYNRKGNRLPEGVACFYNKSRLKKVTSKHVVLSWIFQRHKMFTYLVGIIKKNKEVWDQFMKQPTSLQVTLFKTNYANQYLIVANTHLFYHPDAGHIRLLQINMATTYLDHMKKEYNQDGIQATVIFCGDFNSSPDKSLFKYMTTGTVESDHEDVKKISEDGKTRLYHKFVFSSACGTPLYTNYTQDYKGCLDYIFIEKDKMDVVNVVPMTPVEELQKHQGLPNEFYPSDHLAIVVDVKHKHKNN